MRQLKDMPWLQYSELKVVPFFLLLCSEVIDGPLHFGWKDELLLDVVLYSELKDIMLHSESWEVLLGGSLSAVL